MNQVPTTFRSIFLPGVLAAAAVFLALGLFFVGPCLAATAEWPTAPAPTHEQSPASTDYQADKPVPSAFCRHGSLPSGEALRQDHATLRDLDSRHAEPGVL